MRVIALVSLALTLAVSSMPLPDNGAAAGGSVHLAGTPGFPADRRSTTSPVPGGVQGDVSHLGDKVKSTVAGTHGPSHLGSAAVPGSLPGAGGAVGTAGKATDGAKKALRRSAASVPGEVKGEGSKLEGKVKSTVAGIHAPNNLGSRTMGGGLGGAAGAVGNVGQVAGSAAGMGNGAAKLLPGDKAATAAGTIGGVAAGTAGKAAGAAGMAGGNGNLAVRD